MADRRGYVSGLGTIDRAFGGIIDQTNRIIAAEQDKEEKAAALVQRNKELDATNTHRTAVLAQGAKEALAADSHRSKVFKHTKSIADENARQKKEDRDALHELNTASNSHDDSTFDYSDTVATKEIRKRTNNEISYLKNQKQALVNYLSGERSEEAASEYLTGFENSVKENSYQKDHTSLVKSRTKGLANVEEHLKTLDTPEEKQAYIESIAGSLYDDRIGSIKEDRRTGKYLLRSQKENAVAASLSDNVRSKISNNDIRTAYAGKIQGETRQELLAAERQKTADLNKAAATVAARNHAAYNKQMLAGGAKDWSGKDLKAATEGVNGLDIGWADNADAKQSYNDLIKIGIHPLAAIGAVTSFIDRGPVDDSFHATRGNPDEFDKLANLAKNLSNKMSVNDNGTVKDAVIVPENQIVHKDRTIEQIRNSRFTPTQARSLDKYVKDYNAEKKDLITPDPQGTATSRNILNVGEVSSNIPDSEVAGIAKRISELSSEFQKGGLDAINDNADKAKAKSDKAESRKLLGELSNSSVDLEKLYNKAVHVLDEPSESYIPLDQFSSYSPPISFEERKKINGINTNPVVVSTANSFGISPDEVTPEQLKIFWESDQGNSFKLQNSFRTTAMQDRLRELGVPEERIQNNIPDYMLPPDIPFDQNVARDKALQRTKERTERTMNRFTDENGVNRLPAFLQWMANYSLEE